MSRKAASARETGDASTLDNLLAALYDGVVTSSGFKKFIEKLVAAFGLHSATLSIHHERNHDVGGRWAHGISLAWMERYALQYANEDKLAQHVLSAPIGRFYASNLDLPNQKHILPSRFHLEWLSPQGICSTAASIVCRESNWYADMFVQRGDHHGPFSRSDLLDLDALLPHLERAIRMRERLSALQHERHVLFSSFDLLTTPVFFLDTHCRVTYYNRNAEGFLAANSVIALKNNHLIIAEPLASHALNSAIDRVVQMHSGEPTALTDVVHLSRTDRMPLLLIVASVRLSDTLGSGVGALVLGFDPEIMPVLQDAILRKLFHLTEAETSLAVALCHGKTLEDIAAQRAVTLHTIKSQLKAVFAKTGTSRQAGLVALLLACPAGVLSQAAMVG